MLVGMNWVIWAGNSSRVGGLDMGTSLEIALMDIGWDPIEKEVDWHYVKEKTFSFIYIINGIINGNCWLLYVHSMLQFKD